MPVASAIDLVKTPSRGGACFAAVLDPPPCPPVDPARGGAPGRGETGKGAPGRAVERWRGARQGRAARGEGAAGSSSTGRHCALQQGLRDDMLHRSIDLVATVRETVAGTAWAALSPLASLPSLVSPLIGYEG